MTEVSAHAQHKRELTSNGSASHHALHSGTRVVVQHNHGGGLWGCRVVGVQYMEQTPPRAREASRLGRASGASCAWGGRSWTRIEWLLRLQKIQR